MNKKIGSIANYFTGLIFLGMGVIYLFKNSFMPYHSDAISLEWNDINPGMQFLILALMRVVAGGYIAIAIVIAFLQNKFTSVKSAWMPLLILISGLILGFVSIYAVLIVRFNSPGRPPILLAVLGILSLVLGYIFNKRALKK